MKIKKPTSVRLRMAIWVVALLASCLLGFELGKRVGFKEIMGRNFILGKGVLYTEEEVEIWTSPEDFSGVSHIRHRITIEGVDVQGKITSVSTRDVIQIVEKIGEIENVDPIISIKVLSETQVEVMTGTGSGPLSGGGFFYELIKRNESWFVVDTGNVRGWVS